MQFREVLHHISLPGFYIDIKYVPGKQNNMADALSRVETLSETLDHSTLATPQQKLWTFLQSNTSLQLKKVQFHGLRMSPFSVV